MLRKAGIPIECVMLSEEARRLNEAFITYKTKQRPFGILKIAMTLDGKIGTRTGESKWITSEESRAVVHQLRHRADALITGSAPVIADNPRLTDRSGLPRRRPLLRVILDRRGRLSEFGDALIFRGDLSALSTDLYSREIQSFILECGPDLALRALRAGIIDKIVAFIQPTILGGREIPPIWSEDPER